MIEGIIDKKNMKRFVETICESAVLDAPVDCDGEVRLVEACPGNELSLEYSNFKLPVKREVFPWCEIVGEHENGYTREVIMPEGKRVLFGVRPCDAASLLMLDSVFLKSSSPEPGSGVAYEDPYYRMRRENTLVIVMACNNPAPTCFCTSVDGGPFDEKGADIMSFDLDDVVLFRAVTEKGQAFMDAYEALFSKPSPNHQLQRDKRKTSAEEKIQKVDIAGASEALNRDIEPSFWEKTAERCLACGTCTYLCPSCHCFGFHDEVLNKISRRIRVQDACMFPSFTLEASGHNPRPGQAERLRQRIMHKLRYTRDNYDRIFCVGCGRCITNCPVNIDIREIAREVNS
jgi:ferredoxin